MKEGQEDACSADTHGLKVTILEMFYHVHPGAKGDPTLKNTVKSSRGFKNEHLGGQLCPVNMEWSDSE